MVYVPVIDGQEEPKEPHGAQQSALFLLFGGRTGAIARVAGPGRLWDGVGRGAQTKLGRRTGASHA